MNIHVRNAYECYPASRETTRRCAMTAEPVPHLRQPPSRACRRSAPPRRNRAGRHGRAAAGARPGREGTGQIATKFLTTDGLRPAEREAFWRHAMSGFRPVTIAKVGEGTFEGSIRSHRIGRLLVAKVRSTAQDIWRTPRDISPSEEEYFHVLLMAIGPGRVTQDDQPVDFIPGDWVASTRSGPSRCFSRATGTHTVLCSL